MFRLGTSACRVWSKFSVKSADSTLKFVIQDLPKNRINDFLDFKLNHYMKYEEFHLAAGILENPEAIKEYLNILSEFLNEDSKGVTICCTDEENESSKIVAISAMKLMTLNDIPDLEKYYKKAKTKEVAELYKSFIKMDDVYPITKLMKKFGLERYYEDSLGIGVHDEYRGLGICQRIGAVRQIICKENNVQMCGAWALSYGTQIAAERAGWEIVFKISTEDLAQRLNMKFKDPPKYVTYVIGKT